MGLMARSSREAPRVVAVFGGNGVTDLVAGTACAIARSILDNDAIVLSGGDGRGVDPGTLNVKDEANAVARADGTWIAVLNNKHKPRACLPEDGGLVVRPESGHQRNLLEAWLADACVVLGAGAGDGTLSELVCALCLGRPVLLVADPDEWAPGSGWATVHGWFGAGRVDQTTAGPVLDLAHARLGAVGPMTDLVRRPVAADHLHLGTPSILLDPSHEAGAVSWVKARVGEPRLGSFPTVAPSDAAERAEFRDLRSAYDMWLRAR